jgi:hypothetical protein
MRNVYALCEIGQNDANALRKSLGKSLDSKSAKSATGGPAMWYSIAIRKVSIVGWNSESLSFIREDKVENSGRERELDLKSWIDRHSWRNRTEIVRSN